MVQNVLDWLDDTARRSPDKTAFEDTQRALTFAEVRARSRAMASALAKSVGSRAVVAVLAGRSALTPAIYLSAVYAGCCYAPLDAEAPADRLRKILAHVSPAALIADESTAELARSLDFPGETLLAEELADTGADEAALAARRAAATIFDPLYIIFTSGSSGTPKGVITSQLSLINYIDAYAGVVGVDETDILGCQSPLSYIAAIRDIYLPLKLGASTLIIPKQLFSQPVKLFELLNEKRVTAIGWSVSAFTICAGTGVFKHLRPEHLKKISFSGSVMPCRCLRLWQEQLPGARFVHQYGPTEATASCSWYAVEDVVGEDEVLPIGRPYQNYTMFLLDENDRPVPAGELGEICVGGPGVTLGYYNDPERTAAAFVQNPLNTAYREIIYKTGDVGRVRPDGLFEFHGRRDRQIKHLGHRVELDEIEEAAGAIPGVEECACLYHADRELIYLFYTGPATDRDLATALRAALPGYMVPRRFVPLGALPRLSNGKTDLQTLKESYFK